MYSFKEIPTTASASATALFSAYASVAASTMLVRSMANEIVPAELRSYISSAVRRLFTPLSSELTLVVDEFSGMSRNEMFDAAELYLRTRIPSSASRLRVAKLPRQKAVTVAVEKGEKIPDEFDGVKITWQLICQEPKKKNYQGEEKHFEITFNKKFKSNIIDSYLPHVLARASSIKIENRVIKLYSRDCPYGEGDDSGGDWGSINLEHPSTFDTLAMDAELKRSIIDDLDRFLRRREFYKKVGKAWKRGYLLYGPPGTGKSSLIAAMANYLGFDVYDVELTSIYSNSDLRRTLLATTNRSILVIEDIDCSVDLKSRNGDADQDGLVGGSSSSKMTLSGLLNFIDGLWSSCGDERIIVFTTNHKERLDPALLRPGRMDMHINMSYCTKEGFRILANNYLGVQGNKHPMCEEIEGLIGDIEVTPAQVAEELMKSDSADVALEGLTNFLKRKRVENIEKEEQKALENNGGSEVLEKVEEKVEVIDPKPKRIKMSQCKILCRNTGRRGMRGRLRRRI